MTNKEQEKLSREELDALIAAGEAEEQMKRKKTVKIVALCAFLLIVAIGSYVAFRPEPIPEIYTTPDGNVDWAKQAEKFRKEGKYKEVYDYHFEYAQVSDGKHYGLIDVKGNLIVPIKYDEVSSFSDPFPGYSLVRKDNKYGLVDKNGKEAIPVIYDDIASPTGGVMKVKQGDSTFYINSSGARVEM